MSISQTEQALPAPARRESVVMGRLDFLSVLLRLTGVELYKIRRRVMSKVLGTVGITIMLLAFTVLSLATIFVVSSPADTFAPPQCSANTPPGTRCLNRPPTQEELTDAKNSAVRTVSEVLRPPTSFTAALAVAGFIGLVTAIILAGTIVGGEYSVGTIRLVLSRGPTRTQFLLAKIGAIIVCIFLGTLITVPLGVLAGLALNLISGIGPDFNFLNGTWIIHNVLRLLIVVLNIFMFAMIALFLATLGRATAAGVAGALVWWVLESILGNVLTLLGANFSGSIGQFVRAIPDYFIGNNITALAQNQLSYTGQGSAAQLSDLHAVLVLAGYLVVLIGLSWWVNERRDITN